MFLLSFSVEKICVEIAQVSETTGSESVLRKCRYIMLEELAWNFVIMPL